VKGGAVDVVVCTSTDRLVATPQELMAVLHEFEENEVDVEVIG
jgi:DNA invertase Pin-like site-specific DNA recombinase